jgi:hypothetical protein
MFAPFAKPGILPAVIACVLAFPALAQEGYRFHIRVTDARTGLLANPKFEELKIPADQLERAANERVMVFDHAAGGHWMWLMLGIPVGKPAEERGINARGGATPDAGADIGLTLNEDGTVRTRCLRPRCRIRVTTTDKRESSVTLESGQWKDLPLDADFDLAFER